MLILSQDKSEVINFNNVVRLEVSNNTQGQALIEVHNFCDDFETVIGLYRTEERAKEVLKEIITTNSNFSYFKNTTEEEKDYIINLLKHKYELFDIFQMPKE